MPVIALHRRSSLYFFVHIRLSSIFLPCSGTRDVFHFACWSNIMQKVGKRWKRESKKGAAGPRFNEQRTRRFKRILRALTRRFALESLFELRFSNERADEWSFQSRNCVLLVRDLSAFSLPLSHFVWQRGWARPRNYAHRKLRFRSHYQIPRRGGSLAKYSCSERDGDNGTIRSRREEERTVRGDKEYTFKLCIKTVSLPIRGKTRSAKSGSSLAWWMCCKFCRYDET